MKMAILDAVPPVYWDDDERRNDGDKFKSMLHTTGVDAGMTVHCITQNNFCLSVSNKV